jgi:hypothetical protein
MFKIDYYYFLKINLSRIVSLKRIRSDVFIEKASQEDWEKILSRLKKYSKTERKEILSRLLGSSPDRVGNTYRAMLSG